MVASYNQEINNTFDSPLWMELEILFETLKKVMEVPPNPIKYGSKGIYNLNEHKKAKYFFSINKTPL